MGKSDAALALVFATLLACGSERAGNGGSDSADASTGSGGGETGGETGDTGEPNEPMSCGDAEFELGNAPLRRLTREQYNNTVRDLLGDTSRPGDAFPADDRTIGFAVAGSVSPLVAQHYLDAAEAVAETAIADLSSLLPCDPAGGEDVCASDFIADFGRRAYRRPLEDEETARLEALYSAAKTEFGFDAAIATLVEFVLQSPGFLYRVELGAPDPDGDGVAPLTNHETASRLSYLLWNTMPDDELLDAADAGDLSSPEALEAHARRMLEDPRAAQAVASFHRQWLDLDPLTSEDKDPAMFPNWDSTVAQGLIAQTETFVQDVILNGDGSLVTLLTQGGDQRSGLLTQESLMARLAKSNQTDPVARGAFVRQRLLCQELPPPPNDVDIDPPDPDPNSSARERFAEHSDNPACSTCHQLIDPVGFGFENYDAVGAYQTEDGGGPVDASGELFATRDIDGPFEGAVELGALLAGSEEVRECVATQWFRFAFGRAEQEADACTQTQIQDAFAAADYNIRELLVGIVRSDGFRFKKVED